MKLSICIIAKNEEKHIERCLKSLYQLVEESLAEIVFVDTGSTDTTVEIARKYTNNIYFYNWKNDFAQARNYSISKAKGEYLLIIDADEEIEEDSLGKIINLFNNNEYKKFNAFTFKEKNFIDKQLKDFGVFTRAFIFKNSQDFFYVGSIHEQPSILEPRKDLDVIVLHYGYIMNEEVKEKKYKRNSEILKKGLIKNPENLYYRYQLSVTYEMHNDLNESVKEIEILMNLIKNKKYNKLFLLYYSAAARIYTTAGMYDKVIEICNKGLGRQEDFIDLIYSMIYAFYKKKCYKEALKYAGQYLKLLSDFKNHEIFNDTRFLFYSLNCRETAQNIYLVCSYKTQKISLLQFIESCNLENIDKTSTEYIIEDLIAFVKDFNNEVDVKGLNAFKKSVDFILQRTLNSKQIKRLSKEEYLYIIDKYLKSMDLLTERDSILKEEEKAFLKEMKNAFINLEKGDLLTAIRFIKIAVEKNNNMARAMEIYIEELLKEEEKNKCKDNNEFEKSYKELKIKIQERIEKGLLEEAQLLINECEKYKIDEDIYSMKAIIMIMSNKYYEAEDILKSAILKYSDSFDLLYNLAYVYEVTERRELALNYYRKSLELCKIKEIRDGLVKKLERENTW
ncbi:glycosyltransferase family 2 protein [Clostridium sp. OS1-26]|uniref:glycosyltransferase family 2 protein n=1 Tax=Clostridium sp. OS1-26 TaxID=3070681 RepID=UPI0027E099E7|nr:glycosyltransferase family 2 protein [Clostridium sp. OS1-26]WML35497.1 glycosyltransferase family 2 protein [Clostridium sp. OS1-26]